ncbi:hypothetical protein BBK36DRAFT_1137854 [Trichoderma citrinoviride]|uniref:Uncharacterized protein n=1 Tax=Trichoderma citrinoviride TaxID=58853 RepID=A0A2T4BJC4_9HYPO|nr:hypothetical protein BBK36DRAFT_1137854 [Trichoderma citrinoviride]PTB69417.1 hypothetical protein BBK36DRAFT_1137854 [Trichoderma citrinoviride]
MSAGGSHKHAGGNGKHKASASSSNHQLNHDPSSFLFVINELIVRDDDSHNKGDDWYNLEPPSEPRGFADETIGTVMRYHNGEVTEAPGYRWHRDGFDVTRNAWPPGHLNNLYMLTDDGNYQRAVVYKQLAVFSCNPLLPIAILIGDPLSASGLARVPLLFHHPRDQEGVSHAVHPDSLASQGGAMCKFVAGSSPSWMPSLVPETYRNPYHPGPSRGLSGELPIILGLMAFSEAASEGEEAARRIFLDGRRWRNGEWHHSAAPRGYARSALEKPRGFLVTVFFDPENEAYSNVEYLYNMEWRRVIIRESKRQTGL